MIGLQDLYLENNLGYLFYQLHGFHYYYPIKNNQHLLYYMNIHPNNKELELLDHQGYLK